MKILIGETKSGYTMSDVGSDSDDDEFSADDSSRSLFSSSNDDGNDEGGWYIDRDVGDESDSSSDASILSYASLPIPSQDLEAETEFRNEEDKEYFQGEYQNICTGARSSHSCMKGVLDFLICVMIFMIS